MTAIYGHKWTSHLGLCSNSAGELTESAKTWQRGLAGLTVKQIGRGFGALVASAHDWPPSLPEFRKLCLETPEQVAAPSLDEVVRNLTMASSRKGSLVDRFKHPLTLAISQQVDLFALRTAKTETAKAIVKPVYDKLLQSGWPDWPEHAQEEQKAITREVVVNKDLAKSALAAMRKVL